MTQATVGTANRFAVAKLRTRIIEAVGELVANYGDGGEPTVKVKPDTDRKKCGHTCDAINTYTFDDDVRCECPKCGHHFTTPYTETQTKECVHECVHVPFDEDIQEAVEVEQDESLVAALRELDLLLVQLDLATG
jgi:hypothetical protein